MRQLLTLFLSVIYLTTAAQVIKGTVYRAGTNNGISQASVYYNGSVTGTSTNASGAFELPPSSGKMPVVVSCVGYYSTVLMPAGDGLPMKIYLKPKENELAGVTIHPPSSIGRVDMERMFFKIFIGTSDNALDCTITNIDDIQLYYSRKTETLIASCDKPIQVENKRLAYHITYYLDRFKSVGNSVVYDGNSRFTDLVTPANQKKVSRYRQDAYDGSRMEFIRALHSKTLAKHGFAVYRFIYRLSKKLPEDSIVTVNKAAEQYINLKYKVTIVHNGEDRLASELSQSIENCYINSNGFHDTGLQWFGYMGSQRVGDMLPFEYNSAKEIK